MRLVLISIVTLLLGLPAASAAADKPAKSKVAAATPKFVEGHFKSSGVAPQIVEALAGLEIDRKAAYEKLLARLPEEEARLAAGKRGPIDTRQQDIEERDNRVSFPSRRAKLQWIGQQETRIGELKTRIQSAATDPTFVPAFQRRAKAGLIGRFSEAVRIVRVVNDNESLVDTTIDDARETIWLSGFDLTKLNDGKGVRIGQPLLLTGTKTYEDVRGEPRTAWTAEAIDVESFVAKEP